MTKNKETVKDKKIQKRNFPSWNGYVIDRLKRDPEFFDHNMKFALKDFIETGDNDLLRLTLKQAATAKGITQLAKETGLSRQYIYEMLSEKGNPTLATFQALLKALGFKLYIRAISPAKIAKSV